MGQLPRPTIRTLPDQILQHILNFLSKDRYLWYPLRAIPIQRQNYHVSQLLVLRLVCRRFRYITADPEILSTDLATSVAFFLSIS